MDLHEDTDSLNDTEVMQTSRSRHNTMPQQNMTMKILTLLAAKTLADGDDGLILLANW